MINPVTHVVTHIVLEDKSLPGNATRLVPRDKVAAATGQQVTLNCAKADVAKMPPFAVTDFVQQTPSGMAYSTGDVYSSQYVFDDRGYSAEAAENLPAGKGGDMVVSYGEEADPSRHVIAAPVALWQGQDENGVVVGLEIEDAGGQKSIVTLI